MTSITRENGLMLSLSGGVEIQLARFHNDRLAGYTPVDKVLSILREEEFFVRHKLDQNSHLQSMFVAHPELVSIYRENGDMLMLDCCEALRGQGSSLCCS